MTPRRGDVAGNAKPTPIRHTLPHNHPFTHHFAHFTAAGNCHEAFCNDTEETSLHRQRGGGPEVAGHRARDRSPRGDGATRPRFRVRLGSGLGTGGATALSLAALAAAGRRDCQVPHHVECCVRHDARGAAGSEWALPPGRSSIALERELEQRRALHPRVFRAFFRAPAERASTLRRQTCRQVGETPGSAGLRSPGLARPDVVRPCGRVGRDALDCVKRALLGASGTTTAAVNAPARSWGVGP